MEADSKKRNVQQHFVTAAYLVGFTPEVRRDSQLWIYERNSDRVFRLIPDEAAKRRNYYSIPLEDGGFNDIVDTMLTDLERQAIPVLQKLLGGDYKLSIPERAMLGHLIAFQEVRTPWARASFQRLELQTSDRLMRTAMQVPGYFERVLEELKQKGEVDSTADAAKIRDAIESRRIKLVARPHAGVDLIVSTAMEIGRFYTQMRWTLFRTAGGEFITSDAPVVRRDPGFRGGFYGGGLLSPTAQVWFPLSKKACLLITHDNEREKKYFGLLESGKVQEAEEIRSKLPEICDREAEAQDVQAINEQTILNGDRFVFSPFQDQHISSLFKGECQNYRIVVG